MFNLIEVLPVMPGPCQLFDWEKMKSNEVVSEYFKLLLHTEKSKRDESPWKKQPKRYKPVQLPNKNKPNSTETEEKAVMDANTEIPVANASVEATTNASITWTEFLYANMRLAEDRVLSFVTVFSTGYGTKWIPGALLLVYVISLTL